MTTDDAGNHFDTLIWVKDETVALDDSIRTGRPRRAGEDDDMSKRGINVVPTTPRHETSAPKVV